MKSDRVIPENRVLLYLFIIGLVLMIFSLIIPEAFVFFILNWILSAIVVYNDAKNIEKVTGKELSEFKEKKSEGTEKAVTTASPALLAILVILFWILSFPIYIFYIRKKIQKIANFEVQKGKQEKKGPIELSSSTGTIVKKVRKGYIISGVIMIILSALFIWAFSPTSYNYTATVSPMNELRIEVDNDIINSGDIIEGKITVSETNILFRVEDEHDVIYNADLIYGEHNFKFTAIRDGSIFFVLTNPSLIQTSSISLELTVTSPEWPTVAIFFGIIMVAGIILLIIGIVKKKKETLLISSNAQLSTAVVMTSD